MHSEKKNHEPENNMTNHSAAESWHFYRLQ